MMPYLLHTLILRHLKLRSLKHQIEIIRKSSIINFIFENYYIYY